MHTNKKYAGWFLKAFRIGTATGAGEGAGKDADETGAPATEGADTGGAAITVEEEGKFGALRFESKEAPTDLKYNSERVFRRFAGERALLRWKIDGTTIT